MSRVSLPIFYVKSLDAAPTFPYNCWGPAPVTIIEFLKVGYGDNYNTKMRPLVVNVTEIHCQTIFFCSQ